MIPLSEPLLVIIGELHRAPDAHRRSFDLCDALGSAPRRFPSTSGWLRTGGMPLAPEGLTVGSRRSVSRKLRGRSALTVGG
jgi:hypothetical protein